MEQQKEKNILQQIEDLVDVLEEENRRKVFDYAQNAVEIEQNCKRAIMNQHPQYN